MGARVLGPRPGPYGFNYLVGHWLARARDTNDGKGEPVKFGAGWPKSRRIRRQGQFRPLRRAQKRDDNLDTSLTPTPRLIIEPFCAAGPRDNAKSSSPRPSDPENLCCHLLQSFGS